MNRTETLERMRENSAEQAALRSKLADLTAERAALELSLQKMSATTLTNTQKDIIRKAAAIVRDEEPQVARDLMRMIGVE